MSFFKKFTNEFKDLKLGGKDKPAGSALPPLPPPPPGGAIHGHGDGYARSGQQYPPLQHNQHSDTPAPQPPLWIQHFDQATQRYYYVETTGRSQWEPPQDLHGGQRSIGCETGAFYNQYGGTMPTQGDCRPSEEAHQQNAKDYYGAHEKKDHDKRNMLLAAGAGLAVGGLTGAAFAGDDSDEEHHTAPVASPTSDEPYGYGDPAPPPAYDSDAESLREAQQEYNEAVEAAADSEASSDELGDLQEAHKELEEEREEYYEDWD